MRFLNVLRELQGKHINSKLDQLQQSVCLFFISKIHVKHLLVCAYNPSNTGAQSINVSSKDLLYDEGQDNEGNLYFLGNHNEENYTKEAIKKITEPELEASSTEEVEEVEVAEAASM